MNSKVPGSSTINCVVPHLEPTQFLYFGMNHYEKKILKSLR